MKRKYTVSKYNLYSGNYIFNLRQRSLIRGNESLLNALQNGDLERVPYEVIEVLNTAGMVVEEGIDETKLIALWVSSKSFNTNTLSVAYIPTYSCNFRCIYCYAESVRESKGIITRNTNEAFLNWLENVLILAEPKYLDITFHGGEPLLLKDELITLSENILKLCELQEVKLKGISLVTNGSLLTDQFVKKITNLAVPCRALVTIDGPETVHNARRYYRDGSGSFSKIVENIKSALDSGMLITLGYNYDRQNYADIPHFLDFLVDNGFSENEKFQLIFGAVRKGLNQEEKEHFMKYEMGQAESAKVMIWAYREALKRGLRIVEPLGAGLCTLKKPWSFIVDCNGDIFKCITMAGHEVSKVGTISEPVEVVLQRSSKFIFPYNWEKFTMCRNCKYLPICLGGCFEQAIIKGKRVDCKRHYFDSLFPQLIDLIAEVYEKYPEGNKDQKIEYVLGTRGEH
ncbi:MAG: radical SAM protein [candidate division WOR-3 bacterium]